MKPCNHCQTELADDALFCLKCGQSQVTDDDDTLLGQVVADRYLIKRRIGSGSSGTVYEARHITLQQRMAVKFLHHHLCQDDVAVERFRREATTVAHLDNPHLIQVRDFGVSDDGRLYLAMEFLEGKTLADLLAESSPLSIPQTLDLLNQTADALTAAHEAGYVHRDLRPANLFLTRRGAREEFVKVMDFGLSKLILHELEPGQATVGMSFGDPTYLSPEQAAGEAADRRADVYALGVMAFEMLTGAPPFRGDDVFATINMHLRVRPEAPSRRNHALPFAFDAPILKALAKKREDRFESVNALCDALGQAAASTTRPGLGSSSSGKRRRDQTMPSVPTAIRKSAEMATVDVPDDPNTTRLGLGSEPVPPALAKAAAKPQASEAPQAPAIEPAPAPVPAPTQEKPPALADTVAAPATEPAASAPPPVVGGAAATTPAPLPERPEGSGPHPIPPEGRSGVTTPAHPDEEAPDPTMSQMWYAEGEAEAAEAMAEYEEFRQEEVKAGRGKNLPAVTPETITDPVIRHAGASTTSISLPRSGARTLAYAAIGVVVVVVIVVAVLLSRRDRRQGASSTGKDAMAQMDATDPGQRPEPRRIASADGGTATPAPDGGVVTVVDMAVRIDAPGPRRAHVGPRRHGPSRHSGMRPEPERPPPRKAEAAEAVASGRRALARGDTGTARLEFQRALTVRPGYPAALAGLGEVYFEMGRYAAAAAKLRAAVRGLPSSVRTWVLLGNAYFRSGRYASARTAYKTALRLRPGHAEATRNLKLVQQRLGGR